MKAGSKFQKQVSKKLFDSLNVPIRCPIQPKLYTFEGLNVNNVNVPFNIPFPKCLIKSEVKIFNKNLGQLQYAGFCNIENLLINKKAKST